MLDAGTPRQKNNNTASADLFYDALDRSGAGQICLHRAKNIAYQLQR
jgi:hypothetical protein